MKPLLKIAIPLIAMGCIQSALVFFQTVFLAHVNADVLAAGALGGWLYGTLVVIAFGTMSAINVLVSHKHGENDQEGMGHVLRDGVLLAFIMAMPSFLLLWYGSHLFLYLGQNQHIALLATQYLRPLAWSILPNLINIAFLEFIIGLGRTRIVLIFTIVDVFFSLALNYVFIFGLYGFPKLGITGVGWSGVINCLILMAIVIAYMLCNKSYHFYMRYLRNFDGKSYLWELIKIGIPMGGMYCFEVGFFLTLTILMGKLGPHWIVVNQIAMQYMCAFMSVIFSIAQAITVRMGYLIGAKELPLAKHSAYLGVGLSVIVMLTIAVCYYFIPNILIRIDVNLKNTIIVSDIKTLFKVAALFQLAEGIRISLFGALRALKDTHFPLGVSLMTFWCIALPMGYVLANHYHFNGVGFWWGMSIGAIIAAVLLYRRFELKFELLYLKN